MCGIVGGFLILIINNGFRFVVVVSEVNMNYFIFLKIIKNNKMFRQLKKRKKCIHNSDFLYLSKTISVLP